MCSVESKLFVYIHVVSGDAWPFKPSIAPKMRQQGHKKNVRGHVLLILLSFVYRYHQLTQLMKYFLGKNIEYFHHDQDDDHYFKPVTVSILQQVFEKFVVVFCNI